MNLYLSNCEVRAYKKKNGNVSFHLKTALMTDIGWNFGNSHIRSIGVHFVLPDGQIIEFQCAIHCDPKFGFDGKINAISLDLEAISELLAIEQCVIKMVVNFDFDLSGNIIHEQYGVIRKMYWGL